MMKHRSALSATERHARSKLTKLTHERPFIIGGLVQMARRCGQPRCQCARNKAKRHVSLYLSLKHEGKRKMIYVPPKWESYARECLETYQDLWRLVERISESSLECIQKSKKQD
jgi:hypothetical protein